MSRINRRLLIPIGAAVGVLLLWFVVLWGPQGSALSKAKARASDAVSRRATLRDQLSRLQAARRDQPLKQSQLETLRVAVPDDPNLAQFILDANDAANASGIDFLSISPTPPAPTAVAPPPTTPTTVTGSSSATTATTAAPAAGATATPSAGPAAIKMSMSITGGYFQVLDFINRLDKLPRIVVIDGLSIGTSVGGAAGQASSGGAPQLAVTLQARMFTTNATPVSAGGTGGTGAAAGGVTTTTTAAAGASTTTVAGGATATSTTAVGGR
jgi:Tfp pilus assembly protein PilO